MSETTINDFSLLCRLFGNLFYRAPSDPILAGTFAWLQQGNLTQQWALSTDSQSEQALATIQKSANPTQLDASYQALFGEDGSIATTISAYELSVEEFVQFREQRAMPVLDNADNVALLLLTASWIEDNLDSVTAQKDLFEQFLLPCLGKFLGKVEAFDTGFYKALAQLTRDALSAMADELEETLEQ
ncbi:hypothetical protein BMT54_08655 [Pasteurellaceae bacterium 15-036681]|nr:hypothetical protein BMT54_08655 [Pasteurellaceae bacterium 15-036681]